MAKRIQPGDVLAIPLKNGRFAFGRVLKDASIGIYQFIADSENQTPQLDTAYAFVVGVYRDVLISGEWPRIFHEPFSNEDDAWPSPMVVRNVVSGTLSIYHRGVMHAASAEQCEGLEPAAVWDKEHILERIMESFDF